MMRRLAISNLALVLVCASACSNTVKPPEDTASTSQQAPPEPEPEPKPDPECDGKPCAAPNQCLSYYGIAGPSGPLFHACAIPCERGTTNDGCPPELECVTIADGPGDVCQ